MTTKIIRTGPGIKSVMNKYKKLGSVDVGIIDAGQHDDSDLTVATIGYIQEFGTEHIPERSFIRSTIKEKRKEIIALQKKLLIKIRKGELDNKKALQLLGEFTADLMKQKIVSLKSPPNTEQTIKRKGSSNPLVDTGQLKNSITYEVNT